MKPEPTPRVEAWRARVGAILVFLDPYMWERELQLLCDVLRSDGRLGSLSVTQTVPIYLSCPDFECVLAVEVFLFKRATLAAPPLQVRE